MTNALAKIGSTALKGTRIIYLSKGATSVGLAGAVCVTAVAFGALYVVHEAVQKVDGDTINQYIKNRF